MKILIIIPFIPYPLYSGGNQAFFSMVDYLKDIHDISVLYPAWPGDGGKTSILGVVRNPARLLPWLSVGATFLGMLVIFLPRAVFRRRNNEN